MSGRDSVCRVQTEQWLMDNDAPYDVLYMRGEKDMRKDAIIKSELFFKYVAPYYDVRLVVDDRNQVVHTWMSIGVKVAHVGNPWESF
jgi:hypothetical protein